MAAVDERIAKARQERSIRLDLSYMGITNIPADIGTLTYLTELDLTGNMLESLPNEIADLDRLVSLYLDDNVFDKFPASVCDIPRLGNLGISYNRLRGLPKEIERLTSINQIDLHSNYLDTLPRVFGRLTELSRVDMSYNEFQKAPAVLWKLLNLIYLDVSSNQMDHIPGSCGNLVNLRYLDISGNRLMELPSQFGKLSNLRYLDLSDNGLSELPDTFYRLDALSHLDISDNLFDEIPEGLAGLVALARLDIRGNEEPILPPRILDLIERGLKIGVYSHFEAPVDIPFERWAYKFRKDAFLDHPVETHLNIESLVVGTIELMRFYSGFQRDFLRYDSTVRSEWLEEQDFGRTGHGYSGYVFLFSGGTLGTRTSSDEVTDISPEDEGRDPVARLLVTNDDCVFGGFDLAETWVLHGFNDITVTRADGMPLSVQNLENIEKYVSQDIYEDFDPEDDDELRLEFEAAMDNRSLQIDFIRQSGSSW